MNEEHAIKAGHRLGKPIASTEILRAMTDPTGVKTRAELKRRRKAEKRARDAKATRLGMEADAKAYKRSQEDVTFVFRASMLHKVPNESLWNRWLRVIRTTRGAGIEARTLAKKHFRKMQYAG